MKIFKRIFLVLLFPIFLNATSTITFNSEDELSKALYPHSLEEVTSRIAKSNTDPFQFEINFNQTCQNAAKPQNQVTDSLLETPIYHGQHLTVFYPKTPKVPFHLCLAFNRDINGLIDVSFEENQELFQMIEKITQIYRTQKIEGFVLLQYSNPQKDHQNRFVVELVPHLPGFKDVKNNCEKAEMNRYMLFRSAPISALNYPYDEEQIKKDLDVLTKAFKRDIFPFQSENQSLNYPRKRYESHTLESLQLLYSHLIELMQHNHASAENISHLSTIPKEVLDDVRSVEIQKCFFCDKAIIAKQCIFETEHAYLFYNMRQFAPNGDAFLILPKRHAERVAETNEHEREDIFKLRQALTKALLELRPDNQVLVYVQDNPATGQTVFHHHEQLVCFDPKTIAFSWTLLSLFPVANVSDIEMKNAQEKFGKLVKEKLDGNDLQVMY